jgi:O-Antigen ligase
MSSDRFQPAVILARPFVVVGLLSLATITLMDLGASLMYAAPWNILYWIAVVLPPALLLLRLSGKTPFVLPSRGWLTCVVASGVILVAAAGFSPYREACLRWTALPLAGLTTFLLIQDWLQANPVHRHRLGSFSAFAAGLLMVVSIGYWLTEFTHLKGDTIFSAHLFEMRNSHPLGHANYTAGLALLSLPWLVRSALAQHGISRVGWVMMSGLGLLVLVTSGSRGGLLGLGTLGVVAAAMRRPGWKRFILLASVVLLTAILLAIANPRARALLTSPDLATGPDISTVQRHAMLIAGLHMGIDHPLLGWGHATTPLVYPRYRSMLDGGAENVLQLHSVPVELWAGLGFAGVAVSVAFLFLAAKGWMREPTAAAALAGYGVFALTDYQLDVPVFVLAVATLGAFLSRPHGVTAGTGARWGLILATLLASTFIITMGHADRTPALNTEALTLAQKPDQKARAIELLRESLALNPDQEIAHFNLGWLLLVSDPADAEIHFREAARLVPDKGGVYFGIGLSRLNQGNPAGAARSLALECLNDPQFISSPWWTTPAIAAEREAASAIFAQLTASVASTRPAGDWINQQAQQLATLASRLGVVSPGPEKNYRRKRIGYPVLMRNQDLVPPLDLYDVREDPRFPASVSFALPPKGWLPSPLLLKLLDDGVPFSH